MEQNQECFWRVRACPVPLEDCGHLRPLLESLVSVSCGLEFRMSSAIANPGKRPKDWMIVSEDDIPYFPNNEKAFRKPYIAATLGVLEARIADSALVGCIHSIQKAERKGRVRIEMTRITQEEAFSGEVDTPVAGQRLTVCFAVRQMAVYPVAAKHEKDHVETAQDSQIFIKGIPNEVPDSVLRAIFPQNMISRIKGDDGVGSATFHIESDLGAQGFMELYDGVLVNGKPLLIYTTLITLDDAHNKHVEVMQSYAGLGKSGGGTHHPESNSAAHPFGSGGFHNENPPSPYPHPYPPSQRGGNFHRERGINRGGLPTRFPDSAPPFSFQKGRHFHHGRGFNRGGVSGTPGFPNFAPPSLRGTNFNRGRGINGGAMNQNRRGRPSRGVQMAGHPSSNPPSFSNNRGAGRGRGLQRGRGGRGEPSPQTGGSQAKRPRLN